MRIALDAMGGDHGPAPNIGGARLALEANPDLTVVLVGDDTESPRTMRISSRAVRLMGWLAGTVVAGLVAASIGIGVTVGKQRASARDPVEFLRDSIASLDRQTTTLRVVAGLDSTIQPRDSTPPAPASVDLLLHRADELSVNLEQVADKLHNDADKVARTPSIMPTAGCVHSVSAVA